MKYIYKTYLYICHLINTAGLLYFGMNTVDMASSRPGDVLRRGRIYVKRSLENLADRSLFELVVLAKDSGQPPLDAGRSIVRITVSKGVQDLKPKWDEQLPTRVEVSEVRTLGY